jgi:hypothetical protein
MLADVLHRLLIINCCRILYQLVVSFFLLVLSNLLFAAPVELLQDPSIKQGVYLAPFPVASAGKPRFIVRQPSRNACLPVKDCSQKPLWLLQQWSTAQDIASAPVELDAKGNRQWTLRDVDGRVQKRLQLGEPFAAVLELNGYSEFAARSEEGIAHYLPDLRHPWPHFLLSQDLPGERLSAYESLPLFIVARVPQDDSQVGEGYDSGVHSARLVLAITVRNRLSGNYFWLTLPLYDDRMQHTGFGCQKCMDNGERCYTPLTLADQGTWRCPEDRVGEQWWLNAKPGTARMIFRMPTSAFVHHSADGSLLVEGDVLPYIKAGIEAVRERHNGKSFSSALFFYELGRFSIGWEVTGFNHVTAELTTLRLQGVEKP